MDQKYTITLTEQQRRVLIAAIGSAKASTLKDAALGGWYIAGALLATLKALPDTIPRPMGEVLGATENIGSTTD